MVDKESATYRPRRAYIEPDAEPVPPERPALPDRNGTTPDRNGRAPDRNGTAVYRNGSTLDRNGTGLDRNGAGIDRHGIGRDGNGTAQPRRSGADQELPKPLYREDIRPNGRSGPASRALPVPRSDPPTEETMAPIAFAPRRPHPVDDETTTILPRSRPTKHRTRALDAIDDYDDDDDRSPLSRRAKFALFIGAVAAVVVIGLVVGYGVLVGKQPQNQPSLPPSGGSSGGAGQPQGQTGTGLLTDASMLSASQAKILDRSRTWKVSTTKHGASQDATAACFGTEPVEGQPTPQQEIVRTLISSGGKSAPVALHHATAYSSPEEASQAYAIASKTLGTCAVAGLYIESGYVVDGIGDQAAGVVVMQVLNSKKTQAHSVVINRTGRVVNVLDTARPSEAIAMINVAKALAQVNGVQCDTAGGACNGKRSVKHGPPPLGGDEPGYLASGDLPPAGAKDDLWVATAVEPPKDDFQGSGCERVNWSTVKAESRSSRVYLIQESGKDFFGLNEITLTMKDPKAASKLVDTIKSDLSSCKTRKLTANVTKRNKVTSIGAEGTKVSGWTSTVYQKSTQGTAKYRVGIVSAGPKVVYTFSNPIGDYDFTNHQWDTIAVRGGERITQVN